MPAKPFNYQSVAGDYQYQAMRHGFPMQRFWHKGKLIFWDEIIAPQLIKDAPGGPIIEIGCGAGLLLQHLASWPQMKVGADINFQALAFLSGRFHELGEQASFSPVCSNGEKLPFKNDSFGGLILSEVLEHLQQPRQVLKEAFRVVKPGGWCYLTTPNYRSFWPWMEKTLDLFKLTPPIAGAQHITPFNDQSLRELIKDWQVQILTSFFSLSPFIAISSEKGAIQLLKKECHADLKRGMLLACLMCKPV